jgi:dienelactone hydrolase
MTRTVSLVSAAALVCFLAGSIALARLDRGGPAHEDVWLEGGLPGTLFLPGPLRGREAFLVPPADDERPPALVLMHGFAGDRASVSSFARRVAEAGIAVLSLDAPGHGRNRNPYRRSRAHGGSFAAEFAAAVDFLRMNPSVDGTRIAVAGYSMGADAAVDYASRDSAVAAAVLISGGRRFDGPFPPANALFLYAAGDPERIRSRVTRVASRLAGVARAELGRTYGDPARGDAVRLVEVTGTDHARIVWREAAVAETLRWLHAAFGLEGVPPAPASDPRVPLLGLLVVAFLAVLPGLGLIAARLAPHRELPSGAGRWRDLTWVGAAFVLTMPLLASAPPLAVGPLEAGDTVSAQFALAGLALLVAIQLRRPELLAGAFARPWATLWAAAVTLVAVTSLLQPIGVAVHRMDLTPERGLAWLGVTLSFLPLALAFNLLLRRGPTGGATLAVVCGRLVMLLVMVFGIGVGVLAPVMVFILPALAIMALVFEALASFLYAGSRNVVVIALVDAGWLALVLAAIMPIRI